MATYTVAKEERRWRLRLTTPAGTSTCCANFSLRPTGGATLSRQLQSQRSVARFSKNHKSYDEFMTILLSIYDFSKIGFLNVCGSCLSFSATSQSTHRRFQINSWDRLQMTYSGTRGHKTRNCDSVDDVTLILLIVF